MLKGEVNPFDKIWYIDNDLRYAGIVLMPLENGVKILKYADGIYSFSVTTDYSKIYKRIDNISYDIFIHRKEKYLNNDNCTTR